MGPPQGSGGLQTEACINSPGGGIEALSPTACPSHLKKRLKPKGILTRMSMDIIGSREGMTIEHRAVDMT